MINIGKYKDLSLLIVSGSTQSGGQSLKVARYLEAYLKHHQLESSVIDSHALDLPLIGTQKDKVWHDRWQPVEKRLAEVDGVVLVSPEYNGGPSPALLNFMLYVVDQLTHKPALLIGVSAGRGGTYPLTGLRQFGFKNPAYVVIPQSVIVSSVNNVLNDHNFESSKLDPADAELRQRLAEALTALLAYARALRGLAASLAADQSS